MDTVAALPPLAVCFDKDRRIVCEISQAELKKMLSLLRNNNYLGTKTCVPASLSKVSLRVWICTR